MRRVVFLFCALVLLLAAASCARNEVPAASEPLRAETPPTPAPSQEPAGDNAPASAPAVVEDTYLSAAFQRDGEGLLFTGAAKGGGINFINDYLPGADGYISGFVITDGAVYAAAKESFYSLEPSTLWCYPGDGEIALVTDDLSADGRFCLAGDRLFCQSYADGSLWRYDLTSGEADRVIEEPTALLAAADGYIYYARGGAAFRNNSAMTDEAPLFDFAVLRLFADRDGLCDLTYGGDDAARLEFRDLDGTLTASVDLPETADNLLYAGGRAYVPQPTAGTVLVYDREGTLRDTLTLDPLGVYAVLWYADNDALYYETFLADSGSFALCRLPLDGGEGTVIGEMIQS